LSRYKTLDYAESDGVAWVTLNRPEVHNAFTGEMCQEIHQCWRELRANDDVRAIVLTGAGDKAFCAGFDRSELENTHSMTGVVRGPEDQGQVSADSPLLTNDPGDLIPPKTAAQLWKPVIAAVNGMCCAGAFYLLGEVEFIIAAEHATFFDPHVSYGMPAVYESMMLLQRMPIGEVMRLALTGVNERMSAQRAHSVGLVQEVVPAGRLRETAQEIAAQIAAQPPLAVQATVRAVWYAQDLGYRQSLDVAKTLSMTGNSGDTMSGGQQLFRSGQRPEWRLR